MFSRVKFDHLWDHSMWTTDKGSPNRLHSGLSAIITWPWPWNLLSVHSVQLNQLTEYSCH